MSEKIKKNEKAKKQTWRAGNMLYPVPAVMVSCARKGEKPNICKVFVRMFLRFRIMRYGTGYAIPHFLSRE